MAVSDHYLAYIAGKLTAVAPIETRRLFEGVGVYHNNQLFAIVANDKLYFKTDADSCRDYQAFGATPFHPCEENKVPSYYYQLPEAVLNDKRKLKRWILRACRVEAAVTVSLVG